MKTIIISDSGDEQEPIYETQPQQITDDNIQWEISEWFPVINDNKIANPPEL